MNLQIIIVAIIILLALLYVGANVRRKLKSLSASKSGSCGSDCGCGK